MTREEALKWFEQRTRSVTMPGARAAHEAAVRALRPVSWERVKKVWESKWIPMDSTQEHYCRECGVSFDLYSYCRNDYNFCPYCGCAMTPDALEIVKSNLEAISRED